MKICKLSRKAEKDLDKLNRYHLDDFEAVVKEMEYYLTEPIMIDGNKMKVFTNYTLKLFRLRVNGIEFYRIYFREYQDFFYIERIVTKKDSKKALKAL